MEGMIMAGNGNSTGNASASREDWLVRRADMLWEIASDALFELQTSSTMADGFEQRLKLAGVVAFLQEMNQNATLSALCIRILRDWEIRDTDPAPTSLFKVIESMHRREGRLLPELSGMSRETLTLFAKLLSGQDTRRSNGIVCKLVRYNPPTRHWMWPAWAAAFKASVPYWADINHVHQRRTT